MAANVALLGGLLEARILLKEKGIRFADEIDKECRFSIAR